MQPNDPPEELCAELRAVMWRIRYAALKFDDP